MECRRQSVHFYTIIAVIAVSLQREWVNSRMESILLMPAKFTCRFGRIDFLPVLHVSCIHRLTPRCRQFPPIPWGHASVPAVLRKAGLCPFKSVETLHHQNSATSQRRDDEKTIAAANSHRKTDGCSGGLKARLAACCSRKESRITFSAIRRAAFSTFPPLVAASRFA
jgi:hypothetical protein